MHPPRPAPRNGVTRALAYAVLVACALGCAHGNASRTSSVAPESRCENQCQAARVDCLRTSARDCELPYRDCLGYCASRGTTEAAILGTVLFLLNTAIMGLGHLGRL